MGDHDAAKTGGRHRNRVGTGFHTWSFQQKTKYDGGRRWVGRGTCRSTSKATPQRSIAVCKTNRSGKSATLTKNQVEVFCGNLPIKYSLLADLLYYSAGRAKEITTIRVRNINFKDGMLTLEKSSTKTKETRQIPIHPRTVDSLRSWVSENNLQSDHFIFFTDSRNTKIPKGEKAISTQSVDQYFRKTFDWIGIDGASTHSFRRSRLTHLLNAGWNLREIMNISGHKNLMSLQQYLDADKSKTFEKYRMMFDEE